VKGAYREVDRCQVLVWKAVKKEPVDRQTAVHRCDRLDLVAFLLGQAKATQARSLCSWSIQAQ
jgi:hypothetical protein